MNVLNNVKSTYKHLQRHNSKSYDELTNIRKLVKVALTLLEIWSKRYYWMVPNETVVKSTKGNDET